MSKNRLIIAELDGGCNDGGDLPTLLYKAARALALAETRLDLIAQHTAVGDSTIAVKRIGRVLAASGRKASDV